MIIRLENPIKLKSWNNLNVSGSLDNSSRLGKCGIFVSKNDNITSIPSTYAVSQNQGTVNLNLGLSGITDDEEYYIYIWSGGTYATCIDYSTTQNLIITQILLS